MKTIILKVSEDIIDPFKAFIDALPKGTIEVVDENELKKTDYASEEEKNELDEIMKRSRIMNNNAGKL